MAQYKTFKTIGQDINAPDEKSMAEVHQIDSSADRDTLIKNNKIVVIDNYTDWCGPCKACAPRFAVVAKKYGENGVCAFAKENVEDEYDRDSAAEIQGVPCFHFYVNGVLQADKTITGADVDQVSQTVEHFLR